jgi:uncharacterized membrane protein
VSFDDWILALHVLSAFAFVAGTILFWTLIVAVRRTDTPEGTIRMAPIVKVGGAATGIGAIGTLVFGIWLAFSVGDYDIWDPWIIAALVLWMATGAVGGRTGKAYMEGMNKAQELERAGQTGPSAELLALNRTQNGIVLQSIASVLLLLLLVDMIWKPGA